MCHKIIVFHWSSVLNSLNVFWVHQRFLQAKQTIMGNKCRGCRVGWALPLSVYIVCHHLQSMDQCVTCSHVVSLEKVRTNKNNQQLTFAIFNREIMDLECLEGNAENHRKKNICAHIVCVTFNRPPPHSEIICRWFDVVLNGHGLVYFKLGFALQNTLITPIIFDITVNHDLRLLQMSLDTRGVIRQERNNTTHSQSQVLMFFFSLRSPL